MQSKTIARLVGILYIIGTLAGVLSVVALGPVSGAADSYAALMANQSRTNGGALLILLMGLSLAFVPIVLYPFLRKYNETLAVGYVVFRSGLETVTYIGSTVCWLLMVIFVKSAVESQAVSSFQSLAGQLVQVQGAVNIMLIIMFSMGALMLYTVMYTTRIVPRWISIWGLVAILLHLSTAFLDIFGLMEASTSGGALTFIMNFPIFLQEMVMAVWLIVKGFQE